MSANTAAKHERAERASQLLAAIAGCGRHFFRHEGRVSRFAVNEKTGHVWFVDAWREARIYTHYSGRWRGFSEGGTLRWLVQALVAYIVTGDPPRLGLGPWPADLCGGDLWGYGADMVKVRQAAVELGLAAEVKS